VTDYRNSSCNSFAINISLLLQAGALCSHDGGGEEKRNKRGKKRREGTREKGGGVWGGGEPPSSRPPRDASASLRLALPRTLSCTAWACD